MNTYKSMRYIPGLREALTSLKIVDSLQHPDNNRAFSIRDGLIVDGRLVMYLSFYNITPHVIKSHQRNIKINIEKKSPSNNITFET